MTTRVKVSDHLAKLRDRGVDIEMEDGQTFHIDHPQLWPDEIQQEKDPVAGATMMLGGPENYAAFVAAGGSSGLLASVIEDEFGAAVPQS